MSNLTVPGMAHFAGTGPQGKLCKDCQFYSGNQCGQFRRMTGRAGKKFASTTSSCKYFEQKVTHK